MQDPIVTAALDSNTQVSDDCETIDKIAAEIAKTDCDSIAVDAKLQGDETSIRTKSLSVNQTTPEARTDSTELGNGRSLENGLPYARAPTVFVDVAAPATATSYAEVEDKLAEMFAGIDDDANHSTLNETIKEEDWHNDRNDDDDESTDDDYQPVDKRKRKSVPNDSSDYAPTSKKSKAGRPKGSTNKAGRKTTAASTPKSNCDAAGPPAKRGRKKKTTVSSKATKSSSSSSGKSKRGAKKLNTAAGGKRSGASALEAAAAAAATARDSPLTTGTAAVTNTSFNIPVAPRFGPCVHVRTDGSSNVINAPNGGSAGGPADDSTDGTKSKAAGGKSKSSALALLSSKGAVAAAGFSVVGGDRSKIRGLHLSTLSTKYDADTTDTTWMCVFCKRGPHRHGLGDLFGPYLVRTAGDEFEQLVLQHQLAADGAAEELTDVWRRRPTGGLGGVQRRTLPVVAGGCGGGSVSQQIAN